MSAVGSEVPTGDPGIAYSFEFFPPKSEDGEVALWDTMRRLEPLAPRFVSVTYGAGGSTRDRTIRLTARIAAETSLTPVAHLTCVGHTVEELRRIIGQYADAGVRHVLALRGDPPGGPRAAWEATPGGFTHAVELVELIRSLGDFEIGVAAFPEGHPASLDRDADARVLALKQQAGATFAITQFFFRLEDYADLLERSRAHGVTMPIIPGLMPVTNVAQIQRFAELSGAAFPPSLAERFHRVADDQDAVVELGVQVATELGRQLLDIGAPGLHFYTLNRSSATRQVHARLQAMFAGPVTA